MGNENKNIGLIISLAKDLLDPVEIETVIKFLEVELYELSNPNCGDVDELQENEDFERADEYYGG